MAESRRPLAVLFACNWNTVRSPMAAALLRGLGADAYRVESCGLQAGETVDPFAWAVLNEIGLDVSEHRPRTFDDLDGTDFDLVISLSAQAEAPASEVAARTGAEFIRWPCADPTGEDGSREQRLAAYRQVRDDLQRRVNERFGEAA